MPRYRVTYRYHSERDSQQEVVRAVNARDALTAVVRLHENDPDPIVFLRIEEEKSVVA